MIDRSAESTVIQGQNADMISLRAISDITAAVRKGNWFTVTILQPSSFGLEIFCNSMQPIQICFPASVCTVVVKLSVK